MRLWRVQYLFSVNSSRRQFTTKVVAKAVTGALRQAKRQLNTKWPKRGPVTWVRVKVVAEVH